MCSTFWAESSKTRKTTAKADKEGVARVGDAFFVIILYERAYFLVNVNMREEER